MAPQIWIAFSDLAKPLFSIEFAFTFIYWYHHGSILHHSTKFIFTILQPSTDRISKIVSSITYPARYLVFSHVISIISAMVSSSLHYHASIIISSACVHYSRARKKSTSFGEWVVAFWIQTSNEKINSVLALFFFCSWN